MPALELDNGQVLTEGPAIVQYLADQKPNAGLAPPNGTLERYRLQEMLAFISSEIHKTYGPLFNPQVSAEVREERLEYLRKRFGFIDKALAGKSFLLGERFTVADAYLFVMVSWADYMKLDLSSFANIKAFQQRAAGGRPCRPRSRPKG